MKKQTLILFGILNFLISCKQAESKKAPETENKKIAEIKTEEEKVESEWTYVAERYFENDSLTYALKSNLEKIAFDPKFEVSKKPIKNRHVDNLVDTIVTRTYKNTELTSYKAESEEWVYKAKIGDADFELNEFIKIGTKKYVVEKSLAKGINNDTLKIGNLEQTSVFNLMFESGILKSIEYDGYLD
ncbi:hypothetical protein EVU94_13875 [Flavobacteriaceae bacterium 144Ye]|nr:hypothetical protein EVU94_13875 [Flavobacteriaceae bacterium 144Ye]